MTLVGITVRECKPNMAEPFVPSCSGTKAFKPFLMGGATETPPLPT